MFQRGAVIFALAVALAGCAGQTDAPDSRQANATTSIEPERLFIIGQDLDSIRSYAQSDCCSRPDGTTAYLDLYALLSPEAGFGGLGIDREGQPTGVETTWGSGGMNAYMTATEFDVGALAIGLSMTENEHPGALSRLIQGRYDAEIRQLGRFIRLVGSQTYLRIGYEFDGAWNQGYEDREQYIAAYRRIADTLRDMNITNVHFVWQGSAAGVDEVIDGGHENIADWYPGDDYVDWVGLSWFMNPDEALSVPGYYKGKTPGALSDELVQLARERGKPVMIAEAAPQAFDLTETFTANHSPLWDGDPRSEVTPISSEAIWDYWFQPMFDYMDANADVIRALAYINCNWDEQPMWGPPHASGFWGDTRVETNPVIAGRFTAAVERWRRTQAP